MNFAAGKIPLGGKSPQKVYIVYIGVNATGDAGDASPAIFGQPRAGLTSMPVMPWHGAPGSGGPPWAARIFFKYLNPNKHSLLFIE